MSQSGDPSETDRRDDVVEGQALPAGDGPGSAVPTRPSNRAVLARLEAASPRRPPATVDGALPTATQPSLPAAMAPSAEVGWRAVVLLLVVAATATATLYALRQAGTASGLSAAEQAATVAGSSFAGTVRPALEISLAAPLGGVVQEVPVRVGELVHPGDAVVVLDDREVRLALDQALLDERAAALEMAQLDATLTTLAQPAARMRAQLAAAGGSLSLARQEADLVPLRQRQDSVGRAEAVHAQALARYRRVADLHANGVISQHLHDEAQADLRVAEADLQSARQASRAAGRLQAAASSQAHLQVQLAEIQQQQELTEIQVRADLARLAHERAGHGVAAARARLDAMRITATRMGVVTEVSARPGDLVPEGKTVARLADLDRLLVEVPVGANVVNALSAGQSASVRLPGDPDRPLPGSVATVSPLPAPNLTHAVEVEFANPDRLLLVGQPAEVRFAVR